MDWTARIRAAFAASPHVPDDDVMEELAQHARALYDAARAEGLSPDESDRRVIAQLERWQRDAAGLHHKTGRAPLVEPPQAASSTRFAGLTQDVRYAGRLLRRQPRYALLVGLTMALGIGASTFLFSVTYGVLMKPLPWPQSERLVLVKETRGGKTPRFNSFSNVAYHAWRENPATIESLAGWSQRTATLAGAGDPERLRITTASASLFQVLAARPLIGSLFDEKDEIANDVVVLSESLWRQRFGADPDVLGRIVRLDGQPHRIIGVLPDDLAYPDRLTRAWVPFRIMPAAGNSLSMFDAIARLRPGATAAQAASEGTARGHNAPDTGMTTMAIFGGGGPIEISVRPLRDALTADVRRPLVVLLIAVGLLLVTATTNVASLQLARATTRYREMAIRAALGAGSARVARQLLVESLMLGLAGGGAGLLLAWLLHRLAPSVLPADFPRVNDLRMDSAVVLFALLVSMSTSIVLGLLPALRVRRLDLVLSLAEDGTSPIGAGIRSRTAQARVLITAMQVAIACVLLVGASLLGRSFVALLNADRGYDPSGILTARLSLPASMYPPQRRYAILDQILSRLAAMPSVTAAAFTSELPLTPGGSTSAFTLRSRHGVITVQASPRIVSPRSFVAMGMRIIEGRGFEEADTDTTPPVVVVNRAFARRYLGDSALGARLPMGLGYQTDDVEATVIGVIDDVRYLTAAESTQPELYYSFRQFKGRVTVPVVTLLVRTAGDPRALGPALRLAVRDADAGLVPDAVATMEDRMLTSIARPRLYAILLGGFAVFALLVAAVGLFGVLSYGVAQRSRELAVRTALGARPVDIIRLVLGHTLAVTGAGLAAGLLASLLLARALGSLLYGITPHDGITYAGVSVILIVVAAAASFGPARRAAQLDPLRTLRT
jgi:putative ABC transport system permease protein